ncbi:MAG: hypothetical protein ACRYGG_22120 [Janthinobacterium lividum]
MALSDLICDEIARLFGDDRASIQVDDDGLAINGEVLMSPGITALRTFIDAFVIVEQQPDVAKVASATRAVTLQRVILKGSPTAGLIEVCPASSWLFLGSLGSNTEAIDLSACPELVLALAVLGSVATTAAFKNWTSIIESLGPLVVSYGETPKAALAEIGCFCARSILPTLEYEVPSDVRVFTARPGIGDESIAAYVLALEAQDGPDVTIHRLYRIFELEFARSIQKDIASTNINQLWNKLKTLKLSELKGLETTVAQTTSTFSRFTRTDFDNLFGAAHHVPDQYVALRAWLRDSTHTIPAGSCRAHIVYYVRNALVHSKASDGDPSLFGPYEGGRAIALIHLAQDIHDLVREIIAV